jgi:glycine betaine/choline ABC-type transport system substrate-binding protein
MKSLGMVSAVLVSCSPAQAQHIFVGSKQFTESYVLGEIAKTALQNASLSNTSREWAGRSSCGKC